MSDTLMGPRASSWFEYGKASWSRLIRRTGETKAGPLITWFSKLKFTWIFGKLRFVQSQLDALPSQREFSVLNQNTRKLQRDFPPSIKPSIVGFKHNTRELAYPPKSQHHGWDLRVTRIFFTPTVHDTRLPSNIPTSKQRGDTGPRRRPKQPRKTRSDQPETST